MKPRRSVDLPRISHVFVPANIKSNHYFLIVSAMGVHLLTPDRRPASPLPAPFILFPQLPGFPLPKALPRLPRLPLPFALPLWPRLPLAYGFPRLPGLPLAFPLWPRLPLARTFPRFPAMPPRLPRSPGLPLLAPLLQACALKHVAQSVDRLVLASRLHVRKFLQFGINMA